MKIVWAFIDSNRKIPSERVESGGMIKLNAITAYLSTPGYIRIFALGTWHFALAIATT